MGDEEEEEGAFCMCCNAAIHLPFDWLINHNHQAQLHQASIPGYQETRRPSGLPGCRIQ